MLAPLPSYCGGLVPPGPPLPMPMHRRAKQFFDLRYIWSIKKKWQTVCDYADRVLNFIWIYAVPKCFGTLILQSAP